MNIEIFEHEVLGTMHAFGDENGLWFSFKDVRECLMIEEYRANKKFKFLKDNLKQIVSCKLEEERETNHKFIHEKALYQFMCLGESKCCQDFQEWVGEIAYLMDYLNLNYEKSYIKNSRFVTDYEFIKNYVNNINDDSGIGLTAKQAMERLDNEMKDRMLSETIEPLISERKYRTDFTLEEAYLEPYYKPTLSKEEIEEIKATPQQVKEFISSSDELREILIKAYDENRLEDFTIIEESPSLLLDDEDDEEVILKKKPKEERKVKYEKVSNSTCPSWLKSIVK